MSQYECVMILDARILGSGLILEKFKEILKSVPCCASFGGNDRNWLAQVYPLLLRVCGAVWFV